MFTSIGPNFFPHERLRPVSYAARALYVALFASAQTKRICPGLFEGSVYMMAEASGFMPDDVRKCLDELVEFDLVEHDPKHNVLRFCEFLDTSESPSNGKTIKGWFRGWCSVKPCAVRDAHVATLRRLMDDWCRERNKPLSKDHQDAWAATFGGVNVAPRKRVAPRKGLQTDLFETPDTVSGASSSGLDGVSHATDVPDRRPNDFNHCDTVSIPSRYQQDQDPEREKDLFFSSGRGHDSGLPGDHEREAPAASGTPRPHLTLVPPAGETDPETRRVLEALAQAAGGRWKPHVREGLHAALGASVASLPPGTTGPDEIALVGQAIAAAPASVVSHRGDPHSQLSAWLATPGAYLGALTRARENARRASDRSAMLAEVMAQAGMAVAAKEQ